MFAHPCFFNIELTQALAVDHERCFSQAVNVRYEPSDSDTVNRILLTEGVVSWCEASQEWPEAHTVFRPLCP